MKPEEKTEFACKKCDKTFPSEWGLKVHGARMHTRAAKIKKLLATKRRVKATRKVYRRRKPQAHGHMLAIRYCPVCRTDMLTVATALAAGRE